MVNKKFLAWTAIVAMMVGTIFCLLWFANPSLKWASKLGLLLAGFLFLAAPVLLSRSKSIILLTAVCWISRLGAWLFFGYLFYAKWRWDLSIAMATTFLPFDTWKLHKAKEKRLEVLAAQNLPPMNFNLK